jgi:hypothetical protein
MRVACRSAVTVCGLIVLTAAPSAQAPPIEALLDRAATYVDQFVRTFSNVVASEEYVQELAAEGTRGRDQAAVRTRRVLRSDFLLLKVGGPLEWRPFRDVLEVDGRALRGSSGRIIELLRTADANGYAQAARIAQDSARYNLGPAGRTVNTPVLPLLFLQAAVQPRFSFSIEGLDTGAGPDTWRVRYRETATPTIVRGITTSEDRDLTSTGRFWIDADSGRVARSELQLLTGTMTARFVTTYRHDPRLEIAVPVEFREEYVLAEDRPRRQPPQTVTGFARYDSFRRFEVSATATVDASRGEVPAVAALVARAGDYVARFTEAFSNVVTEEHYVQNVTAGVPSGLLRGGGQRDLRADLLLVRVGGVAEYQPFRDVFEVGGAPVRDRDQRLARLFTQSPGAWRQRAEAIQLESSRFNIGGVQRTVNTPVHTLLFLRHALQPRFHFTLDRPDPTAGEGVWVVKYEERTRPTLIRGDRDSDLPASGRFWIQAGTGRVFRTELDTFSGAGSARVTTTFQLDRDTGMAVPAEMREEYQLQRGRITATATYGRFRRFAVSTDTEIGQSR